MKPVFSTPDSVDIAELSIRLREEDCLELKRSHGDILTPQQIIKLCINSSDESHAVRVDGRLACIYGVMTDGVMNDDAQIWLLSTATMDDVSFTAALRTKKEILKLAKRYPYLYNSVDDEYDKCKRWLQFLGFTIEKPKKNNHGYLFCDFWMGEK